MKAIFGERMTDGTFKGEKRYLFITLISFSFSYIVDVSRNVILFMIVRKEAGNDSHEMADFFCKNNFTLSMFNILSWVLVELSPYLVLFCLNLSNFRQMGRQQKYI